MAKQFHTPAEIAERWACSVSVVLDHIRRGDLAAVNVGHGKRAMYRIKSADLEAFERSRSAKQPEPVRLPRRRLPFVEPTFT